MPADAWAEMLLPPVNVRPKAPADATAAAHTQPPDTAATTAFSVHRAAHAAQQRAEVWTHDPTVGDLDAFSARVEAFERTEET